MRKVVADASSTKRETGPKEIDFDKLESIARFINTPSVAKGNIRTFVDRDGNKRTMAKVRPLLGFCATSFIERHDVFRRFG
jgi:hypothetical protein